MKKIVCFIYLIFLWSNSVIAQLKIGDKPSTIQSTSILELESVNKGLLLPRLSNTQISGITSKAKTNNASGLAVYNTDRKCIQVFDASTTSGQWISLASSWALTGNTGTTPANNFIGTTDNVDLLFKTNNVERLRLKANGGTDFANQTIEKFSAKITEISTTTYTLAPSDNGTVILVSNIDPITLNVPNTLPIGFNVTLYQMSTGSINFMPATGVTILQRTNVLSTAGQYAFANLLIIRSGTALLTGDLN